MPGQTHPAYLEEMTKNPLLSRGLDKLTRQAAAGAEPRRPLTSRFQERSGTLRFGSGWVPVGEMKIFLSHSHEQRNLAEKLTARLRADRHRVFQDHSSLPRGEAFDRRIREEIGSSELFVFLLSPDSVRSGCYALTELGIAQSRWPNPAGRVLPVLVTGVPEDRLPPYLGAVSILRPTGELVAEVVNEVHALASRRRRHWYATAMTTGLLASGLVATQLIRSHRSPFPSPRPPAPRPISNLVVVHAAGLAEPGQSVSSGIEWPGPPWLPWVPLTPVARLPRTTRVPTGTRVATVPACQETVEEKSGLFWLVCRCRDQRPVPPSLPLRGSSLDLARGAARKAEWNCPP